jgi:GH18 family chitinase
MAKSLELLNKAIQLYGPLPSNICVYINSTSHSNKTEETETPISFVNFKIYGRYEGSNVYNGYTVDMVPSGIDRILYGYIQYGNCAQNQTTASIENRWQEYFANDENITCNASGFANGDLSIEVYSDNPHADFASWPPNSLEASDQAFNETWNYNIAYNGTKGLNSIANMAKKFPLSLSIGGPSGSIQLEKHMSDIDTSIASLARFYVNFLPKASDSPFLLNTTSTFSNTKGLDIYFEPKDGIWFESILNNNIDSLFYFTSYSFNAGALSGPEGIFNNTSISINGLPGLPIIILIFLRMAHITEYLFQNIDTLIINTYNYHYKTDQLLNYFLFSSFPLIKELTSTNCHSPLFYDIDQFNNTLIYLTTLEKVGSDFSKLSSDSSLLEESIIELNGTLYNVSTLFPDEELFNPILTETSNLLGFIEIANTNSPSQTQEYISETIANLTIANDMFLDLSSSLILLNTTLALQNETEAVTALDDSFAIVQDIENYLSDSILDWTYLTSNLTILDKLPFFQLPLFNVHTSAKLWTLAAADHKDKIFIGASLFGKEVTNIVADNVTDSLYKEFNLSTSAITDTIYNDNNFINPLNPIDENLSLSIVSRINAGILKEEFNINSGCAYAYDKTNNKFVSYDNELSIIMKVCYIIRTGLGGLVFSNLGADQSNELVDLAIDVRANFVNYCKSDYSSEKYPGPYDFSFENIDRLMELTESAISQTFPILDIVA